MYPTFRTVLMQLPAAPSFCRSVLIANDFVVAKTRQNRIIGSPLTDSKIDYKTNQWKVHERIVLCLDMDTPGQETAEQLRKKYAEMGYEISQEKPHIGKDWNEYLQKEKHWKGAMN